MKLANNALRTKNMISLLKGMGIDLEGTKVICNDGLVILNPERQKSTGNLVSSLQSLLQDDASTKPKLKKFSLTELITSQIDASTCTDEVMIDTHKKTCNAVLNVLQMTGLAYTLDEQQEHIEIKLPNPAYAQLFACLNYKYMTIVDDKIKFNIKEFVKDYPNELILIDGQSPLMFINASQFENKKVFYAQKPLENDEV